MAAGGEGRDAVRSSAAVRQGERAAEIRVIYPELDGAGRVPSPGGHCSRKGDCLTVP